MRRPRARRIGIDGDLAKEGLMTERTGLRILSVVFLVVIGVVGLEPAAAQVEQFRINADPCHSPKGPGADHGASVGYIPSTGGFQSITQDSFVFVWACARCFLPFAGGGSSDCGSSCEVPAIGNPYLRRWNQHVGFFDEEEVLLNSPDAGTAINFAPSCAVQPGGDREIKIVWSHFGICSHTEPFHWAELDPFPFHFGPLYFSDFSPRVRSGGLPGGNAWAATAAFSDDQWVAVWNEYGGNADRLMYKLPGGGIGFPPVGIGTGAEVLATDRVAHTSRPCVTSAADNRFVVAWSQGTGAPPYGIRARRIGEGGEIRVGSTERAANPAVAAFEDGSFVVAWIEEDKSFHREVRMARYTSAARASVLDRPAILVNDNPREGLGEDRITVVVTGSGVDDPEGRIVVIWANFSQTLHFRTYTAGGAPLHDGVDLVDPGLPGGESPGGQRLGHPAMHPAVLREDKTLVVAWQKSSISDKNLYATVRTIP